SMASTPGWAPPTVAPTRELRLGGLLCTTATTRLGALGRNGSDPRCPRDVDSVGNAHPAVTSRTSAIAPSLWNEGQIGPLSLRPDSVGAPRKAGRGVGVRAGISRPQARSRTSSALSQLDQRTGAALGTLELVVDVGIDDRVIGVPNHVHGVEALLHPLQVLE